MGMSITVDAVARQAALAFPKYSALPGRERARFLRAVAGKIEALGDELVEIVMAESHLPAARVMGERGRTCGQLRMFADLIEEGSWVEARIETALPERKPLAKPDLRAMQAPLGPVAVFCAANFPLAFSVAGGDTASALAAGCPVIVKAHSGHLKTAELTAKAVLAAVAETGMPEGTFALVTGSGQEAGQALVKHPSITAVGFTGSRAGGTALMASAAARPVPIPVYAEMSSLNPLFLLPQALKNRWEAIAAGLHGAVTGGVGQFCTKPGLVFVLEGPDTDHFEAALASAIGGTSACPMLNENIASNYADRRGALAEHPEVTTLADGPEFQAGLFRTTGSAFIKDRHLQEEVFGPSTLLVLCETEAELIKCAGGLEGQLTASVHADGADVEIFRALQGQLEKICGRLIFNGFSTGVEVCHAIVHGGPFPATSDGRSTSVGTLSIHRWCRALCFQNLPEEFLPDALKSSNPLGIWRLVDGKRTASA